MRQLTLLISLAGLCTAAVAQTPIDVYMNTQTIRDVAKLAPPPGAGNRTPRDVLNTLPLANSQRFATYVASKSAAVDRAVLREGVESLRLNKLVGNTAGGSGTTSLVSKVAVPGLLGIATEYGSILQSTAGTTTTLRGNLLGIARMALGNEQFPYCPEVAADACPASAQWLRRFSGMLAFENNSGTATAGTANTTSGARVPVTQLFGDDYRMASWGLRFDLTRNDPDDPAYKAKWQKAMDDVKANPASSELLASVEQLFSDPATHDPLPAYVDWAAAAGPLLLNAATEADYHRILDEQLDLLIVKMTQANAGFASNVAALRRGFLNYATARDEILRAIQSHKLSAEYTNQHARNQPTTSNLRLIYSHLPSKSKTLLTGNVAFTWYNSVPSGITAGRFRDFQAAGQLDRKIGTIPNLGPATATFAGYYQWMKDDAVIVIGPGNIAPGSGIVLPGTAATLLGTKGHIGIVQGKLSIPVNNVVKIPFSVTWSNRTELINETDIRGQVGLTVDLDSVFKH